MEVTPLGSLLKKSLSSSSSSFSSLLSSSRIVLPLLIQGICTAPFPISTSPPPLPSCIAPPYFVPRTKKPEVSGYENCTEQRSHSWFVHSRPLSFVFTASRGRGRWRKRRKRKTLPFSFLSSPPVRISYALPSLILYQLNGDSGCLLFTKRLRKVRLKRQKWNTAFHVVPVESFREQQNIWNGSPVLPDQERILSRPNVPNRNSCSICEKPLTFNASLKLLRPLFSKTELVCQANGKIEFLLPFALHILRTDRFARVKW